MASRFLQVLLSATVVAFIAVGCGNRGFNPPSDEDMIHNFYAHEDAFNEITEILLNCPYGDIYPPFYPIGSATDSLCLSSLGNEKCTRLDSLLASVGGHTVQIGASPHTAKQVAEKHQFCRPVSRLIDGNKVVAQVAIGKIFR